MNHTIRAQRVISLYSGIMGKDLRSCVSVEYDSDSEETLGLILTKTTQKVLGVRSWLSLLTGNIT